MKYGLSEEQLKQIQDIISSYDEIEEAILFGSRAMDTYKEASDVDIALKGKNVNASLAARLKYRLEEDTYLPFFFDFIAYSLITNQALKKHIDTKGVSIYRAGWKEFKLGDVLEINPTESLSKGTLAKKVSMDMLQPFTKRPPCFSIEEYNGGMKFRNGDTIVARITPCLENGKTAFIDIFEDNEIGFGSTEYIVLRERQGISDKHFLYYFAISPEFRDIAILSMTGSSGRQRVQTDVVRNHSFLLPPFPEQCAITSVLSSLDDKIDLLHRQNKTLEAMAETLFRKWFVEEAQDDWEEGKLGDMVTIAYGKNLPTNKLLASGYPVFGGNGQIGFYDKYLYDEPQVLVSCRGEASGKVNISLPKSFITNNSLILERNKRKEITFEYLKYHSLNYDFTLHVSGSAQPQITIDGLYDAAFLIPPIDLINEFSEIVRSYEGKRDNNLKQIRTLEKLRDTLLPKLMSGEVRITEVVSLQGEVE